MSALTRLDAIEHLLEQHFAQSVQANDALASLLSRHLNVAQLLPILEHIVHCPEMLANIAQRSYVHGNGFVKIVLSQRGAYKLRLHIWFAGCACEENIHDHRWSFASHILLGRLRSEIWADCTQGVCLPEYRYESAQGNETAFKHRVGNASLALKTACEYQAGQSYVLPPEVLHRIINPGLETVASIMCSAPTQQRHTRLLPSHVDVDPQVTMPPLSSTDLAKILRRFIDECRALAWLRCA